MGQYIIRGYFVPEMQGWLNIWKSLHKIKRKDTSISTYGEISTDKIIQKIKIKIHFKKKSEVDFPNLNCR